MSLVFSKKDKPIYIKSLLNNKKYDIDKSYQREPGAWSRQDEQYFIDSIMKGIRVPKIYLHKKRNKFYIIDGQQRIETINYFINGREDNRGKVRYLTLPSDISGRKNDVPFTKLKKNEREKFLKYTLTASIIKRGNDEEIRELFRRLQRGNPLTPGEKLNALPGNIVKLMRKLTEHSFFSKGLKSDKRHKFYHIASVFLYLEDKLDDTKLGNIESFFDKNQNMKKKDKIFRNCWNKLNFMSKIYKNNDFATTKIGWLSSLYLFVSDIKKYGLVDCSTYEDIHDYIESFYVKVNYKPKGEYKIFFHAVQAATNTKANIIKRKEILVKYFEKAFQPHLKDEKRLFSSIKDRKIIYHEANGKCQYKKCQDKDIKFNERFDIHHKKMHAAGGKKDYKNALLVHPECHRAIHKNMKLKRIQK